MKVYVIVNKKTYYCSLDENPSTGVSIDGVFQNEADAKAKLEKLDASNNCWSMTTNDREIEEVELE
jgi:hypothetical protein